MKKRAWMKSKLVKKGVEGSIYVLVKGEFKDPSIFYCSATLAYHDLEHVQWKHRGSTVGANKSRTHSVVQEQIQGWLFLPVDLGTKGNNQANLKRTVFFV